MTDPELYEHVRQLARDYGVRVWVAMEPSSYAADPTLPYGEAGKDEEDEPTVWLSHPPDTPLAYLVALHELGHIIAPAMRGRVRDREAKAWRWAIEQSKLPINAVAWRWIRGYMRSYCGPQYRASEDFDNLLEEAESEMEDVAA